MFLLVSFSFGVTNTHEKDTAFTYRRSAVCKALDKGTRGEKRLDAPVASQPRIKKDATNRNLKYRDQGRFWQAQKNGEKAELIISQKD